MVRFKYAVLCDLVRREDTGKFILIGVYTGGFRFQQAGPMSILGLNAFVCLSTDLSQLNLSFRIVSLGVEKPVAQTEASVERTDQFGSEEEIFLPVPFTNLEFVSGKHSLDFRFNDEDWVTVLEFDVGIQPDGREVS